MLTKHLPRMINAFELALNTVLLIINEFRPAFVAAGENLMEGFRDGMEAAAQRVYEKARWIAAEVQRIINNALEMGSPSRVFYRIGVNLMKGWEQGMLSSQGGVDDAASIAATSVIASLASANVRAARAQAGVMQPVSAVQAPALAQPAYAGGAGGIRNEINMGGQTLNDGLDIITLQLALEQALRNVLG